MNGNIELMWALIADMPKRTSRLVFTPRGREIFKLVLKGKTTTEIAELICISYSGVLRHREKMLEQNDCHSMSELVAKYYGFSSEFIPDIGV